MNLVEFYNKIEEHPDLNGVITCIEIKGVDCMAIGCISRGDMVIVPIDSVESAEWELFRDVLLGIKDPIQIYHMTRVVGYYSRVDNWNSSKIGELKDRHKGNYEIGSK